MVRDTSSTFYSALQLPRSASPEEVRAAYRRLAREHHPDRAGSDGDSMALINQAYEVLSDPERRTSYDQQLGTRAPPRKPGRVTLPGHQRRTWLARGLAGLGVLAVATLAFAAGLRIAGSADRRSVNMEAQSHPLPVREVAHSTEADGLRLIPSRAIALRPAGRADTATRSP